MDYEDRRFICLENDDADTKKTKNKIKRVLIGTTLVVIYPVGILVGSVYLGKKLWNKIFKREKITACVILNVRRHDISSIKFQPGHPVADTVYVGHPGVPERYYPGCDFHRALLLDKYLEAVRLLRSLGATEVTINSVSGCSTELATSAKLNTILNQLGIEVEKHSKNEEDINSHWTFKEVNEAPRIPPDLFWYNDEPTWKEIANGRLEGKLSAFEIDLNYTKDFGVNAKLRGICESAGLDLGGSFTGFEATRWKMAGKFPNSR